MKVIHKHYTELIDYRKKISEKSEEEDKNLDESLDFSSGEEPEFDVPPDTDIIDLVDVVGGLGSGDEAEEGRAIRGSG